jgi:hypothetical protein
VNVCGQSSSARAAAASRGDNVHFESCTEKLLLHFRQWPSPALVRARDMLEMSSDRQAPSPFSSQETLCCEVLIVHAAADLLLECAYGSVLSSIACIELATISPIGLHKLQLQALI